MIAIDGVYKKFHDLAILQGISLDIRRGEVAVLLGPSGSGKSTLLRTINGLEDFDEGEIRVDGIRLGPRSDPGRQQALLEIRRRVGMVFQQFNLFPHRSVLENIMEAPVHVLGEDRASAARRGRELLERVGLADKAAASPTSLSGGQQQRVAIARALAMKPEAILFDEPTSALDPKMTSEVTAVMRDLANSGQTMVVVTHAMDFARDVANTVHILHGGKIVDSGSVDYVFRQSQHPITRQFTAQQNGPGVA